MVNHTPGPWKVASWTSQGRIICTPADEHTISKYIGFAQGYPHPDELQVNMEQASANARLMAAAPELYDAADELLGALADIYSHLQKTSPERLVLPVREAANKLANAMRKVEEAERG